MKPSPLFAGVCLFLPVMAVGEKIFTLSRLKGPPDSITEKFFKIGELGEANVNGQVIQRMRLLVEEGKSHARLSVTYLNKTQQAVSPSYTIRFYNPYGILMGGVRVPEDVMVPEQLVQPGGDGAKVLTPRVTRLDAIFKHAEFKSYPSDFFAVRWLSISDAKMEDDAGGGQPANGAKPKGEGIDKPKPQPEPVDR